LAWCQYKVNGWCIMFICGMVHWCAGTLKPGSSLDHYNRSDNHCCT